ncbi:hypothetical protein TYRP_010824 [Tyrophagus putrescentiae]|nr:hypothetical protein TYRP_010824 [Tyrophagus putrescentiae]
MSILKLHLFIGDAQCLYKDFHCKTFDRAFSTTPPIDRAPLVAVPIVLKPRSTNQNNSCICCPIVFIFLFKLPWCPSQLIFATNANKYMATFPYLYMNGRFHNGFFAFQTGGEHISGKRCLLPFVFHCTRTPIKACADTLKREVETYGYPENEEHEEIGHVDGLCAHRQTMSQTGRLWNDLPKNDNGQRRNDDRQDTGSEAVYEDGDGGGSS